jgi:hypothetical protein
MPLLWWVQVFADACRSLSAGLCIAFLLHQSMWEGNKRKKKRKKREGKKEEK